MSTHAYYRHKRSNAYKWCALWLALVKIADAGLPPNLERVDTSYEWCDCGKGLGTLTFWPLDDTDALNRTAVGASSLSMNTSTAVTFPTPVRTVGWICDGMSANQTTTFSEPATTWSVRMTQEVKAGFLDTCEENSGRIKWNSWAPSPHQTSVPFSSHDEGYACFKIPVLLRTNEGSLIVMSEARTPDCGDFSRTDLVVKRSVDEGVTWSPLQRVVEPAGAQGLCGNSLVVGNAAPVQLAATSAHHPGRILVPHMRNNFEVWLTYSDDDGVTWANATHVEGVTEVSPSGPECARNMSYFGINGVLSTLQWIEELGWNSGVDPFQKWQKQLSGPWQFIGLGPPGSLQLASGRVLVPGYHSYIRGLNGGSGQGAGVALPVSQLYNNFALGHILVSDDGGDTWRLGSATGFGNGTGHGANEAQLVQLRDGSVLVNSRSLSTGSTQLRVQAISQDGGQSFGPTEFVEDLPEPFNGCQGSIATNANGTVFFVHPDPAPNPGIAPSVLKLFGADINLTGRDHLTLWASDDAGTSYRNKRLLDPGASGYSSLQAGSDNSTLWLLYEQSDRPADSFSHLGVEALIGQLAVLNPDRLVLRRIDL